MAPQNLQATQDPELFEQLAALVAYVCDTIYEMDATIPASAHYTEKEQRWRSPVTLESSGGYPPVAHHQLLWRGSQFEAKPFDINTFRTELDHATQSFNHELSFTLETGDRLRYLKILDFLIPRLVGHPIDIKLSTSWKCDPFHTTYKVALRYLHRPMASAQENNTWSMFPVFTESMLTKELEEIKGRIPTGTTPLDDVIADRSQDALAWIQNKHPAQADAGHTLRPFVASTPSWHSSVHATSTGFRVEAYTPRDRDRILLHLLPLYKTTVEVVRAKAPLKSKAKKVSKPRIRSWRITTTIAQAPAAEQLTAFEKLKTKWQTPVLVPEGVTPESMEQAADEVVASVTAYKGHLICTLHQFTSQPHVLATACDTPSSLGHVIMNTGKNLGVSAEAYDLLQTLQRGRDSIGEIDWFQTAVPDEGPSAAFCWMGSPFCVVNASSAETSRQWALGPFRYIPNHIPAQAQAFIEKQLAGNA